MLPTLANCAEDLGKWFLTSVLNVKQYGVGVKDGLVKCIHTLRLQLEGGMIAGDRSDPICALVTDQSNAFNELGLRVVLDDDDGIYWYFMQ